MALSDIYNGPVKSQGNVIRDIYIIDEGWNGLRFIKVPSSAMQR